MDLPGYFIMSSKITEVTFTNPLLTMYPKEIFVDVQKNSTTGISSQCYF